MSSDRQQKFRSIASGLIMASVLSLVILLPACENNSSPSWDYGTNDQNVYDACGDSITYQGYPSILATLLGATVVDDGHGGYTSDDGLDVVRSALATKPGTILILFGANDCIHSISQDTTIANLKSMVDMAKAQQTRPVIANVMPMIGEHALYDGGVDKLDPLIESMAQDEGITMVDLHTIFAQHSEYYSSDGLHPNSDGDNAIAQAFYDALQ